MIYIFTKAGATRYAFKPIVTSGKNACALHYNSNDTVCREGDMILLDFGVCYANYNSETIRYFPVNGKFSKRQKEVYASVLSCLKEGSKLLKPEIAHVDYEKTWQVLLKRN